MAKKKIKVTRQKFKEIKKLLKKIEVKPKEEKQKEKLEVEKEEEQEGRKEQEEAAGVTFEDIFDAGESERKAPILPSSGVQEQELEGMLEGARGKKESREDDSGKGSEKPKYSFSTSSSEDDEAIQELRHIVLKETPGLIERTHEARELDSSRIQDSMLANLGVEEYAVKYVPQHKEEFLHEHEQIKDNKIDVKKYRKER